MLYLLVTNRRPKTKTEESAKLRLIYIEDLKKDIRCTTYDEVKKLEVYSIIINCTPIKILRLEYNPHDITRGNRFVVRSS